MIEELVLMKSYRLFPLSQLWRIYPEEGSYIVMLMWSLKIDSSGASNFQGRNANQILASMDQTRGIVFMGCLHNETVKGFEECCIRCAVVDLGFNSW